MPRRRIKPFTLGRTANTIALNARLRAVDGRLAAEQKVPAAVGARSALDGAPHDGGVARKLLLPEPQLEAVKVRRQAARRHDEKLARVNRLTSTRAHDDRHRHTTSSSQSNRRGEISIGVVSGGKETKLGEARRS